MKAENNGGCILFMVGLALASIAAWITHIVICLQDGEWGFLIAGAIFFPIAIIHGAGRWFGAW